MKTLTEWVNISDEDKYGKFVLMGYMDEQLFEELSEGIPICGTNHFSMIPLECLNSLDALINDDEFLAVVDAEFIRTLRGVAVVNQEDFARFK